MTKEYTIVIPATAVTTAVDLCEIIPADDRPVRIASINIVQTSDVADAEEEILPIQIIRGNTTSGNGTAATPRPKDPNDPAAACTAETIATTLATAGTPITLFDDGWNVRVPYLWEAIRESSFFKCTQAQSRIVVRLPSAPADSLTIRGTITIIED